MVTLLFLLLSIPINAMFSPSSDDEGTSTTESPLVLSRAMTNVPKRTPLARSLSAQVAGISKTPIVGHPAAVRKNSDPRLEEYVRLIVYESDRDLNGIRTEAMRVLVGVKIFRFPHERIVRVTTRSTGSSFQPMETMHIIGLPL